MPLLLALLAACDTPPPERPVSRPVSEPATSPAVEVPVPEVQRPDGRKAVMGSELSAAELPPLGLDALSPDQAAQVLLSLNTTVGPCEVCMQEGMSIARCLVEAPESCENVLSVARRGVRAGARGVQHLQMLPLLRYEDPWLPIPPGERRRSGPEGALTVLVAVDYAAPFSRQAAPVWEELAARYGEALAWETLNSPDVDRHPTAQAAALAALAAERQGRWGDAHRALLSGADPAELPGLLGLDTEQFQKDRADPALSERLSAELALAAQLGVRSAPTAFIGGYRVRGLREASFYAGMIDQLLEDAGDPWGR